MENGKERIMKKRVLMIMCLSIILLAGGCGKKGAAGDLNTDSTSKNNVSTTPAATVTGAAPVKEEYKVDDYFTLGKYKGVEVTVQQLEVTDAQVEEAIQTDLNSNVKSEEVKDRTDVKNGDIVNIDYTGKKDGKAFEGGSSTGYDLTIGSNSFIEGFESGLVGKKVGETVTLNVTFPKEYKVADLAGQPVVFTVKINSIKKQVIPELTEAYVKENTDYDSIDAYKKAKRENLEKDNEATMNSNISNSVIQAIIKDSKVKSYPETLINYYSESYENYVSQMLYYSYQMSVADYIKAANSTQEEFDANIKSVAENYAALEMAERAIAETEKMSISDEDYKSELKTYMSNYGVSSEDELLKYMTKDQIKDDMLLKKALDLAVANAKVTKTTATPTPAPTTAPAATKAAE